MDDKVVAVVPAFNEEEWIKGTVKPLVKAREKGLIQDVLVVDDGSTDGTRRIAEDLGVNVVSQRENQGKIQAFITAAEYCRREGADVMFMADADMLDLTPGKIRDFLNGMGEDVDMIRSPYKQEVPRDQLADPEETERKFPLSIHEYCPARYSGFRAVRMNALKPLFEKNRKWIQYLSGRGYSLENALEKLIPPRRKKNADDIHLESRERGAGPSKRIEIKRELHDADEVQESRRKTARNFEFLKRRKKSGDSFLAGRSQRDLMELAGKPLDEIGGVLHSEPDRLRDDLKRVEQKKRRVKRRIKRRNR